MKKQIVYILISFILLSGCASNELSLRHDVALSFDSERVAYNVVGKGKTSLIFIHGWSCDGRYWQKQIPEFAKKYQVIRRSRYDGAIAEEPTITTSLRRLYQKSRPVELVPGVLAMIMLASSAKCTENCRKSIS